MKTQILNTTIITLITTINLSNFYNPVFAETEEIDKGFVLHSTAITEGNYDLAENLIEKIEDKKVKDLALIGLAKHYAETGQLKNFLTVNQRLNDEKLKDDSLLFNGSSF